MRLSGGLICYAANNIKGVRRLDNSYMIILSCNNCVTYGIFADCYVLGKVLFYGFQLIMSAISKLFFKKLKNLSKPVYFEAANFFEYPVFIDDY